MSPPLEVSVSSDLLEKAHAAFPTGGSVDGLPSFELFTRGPLDAAKQFFARQFDIAPIPEPGAPSIRQWGTVSNIFGPLVFFALRTQAGAEIMDYLHDPDYWQLIADDPDD